MSKSRLNSPGTGLPGRVAPAASAPPLLPRVYAELLHCMFMGGNLHALSRSRCCCRAMHLTRQHEFRWTHHIPRVSFHTSCTKRDVCVARSEGNIPLSTRPVPHGGPLQRKWSSSDRRYPIVTMKASIPPQVKRHPTKLQEHHRMFSFRQSASLMGERLVEEGRRSVSTHAALYIGRHITKRKLRRHLCCRERLDRASTSRRENTAACET